MQNLNVVPGMYGSKVARRFLERKFGHFLEEFQEISKTRRFKFLVCNKLLI